MAAKNVFAVTDQNFDAEVAKSAIPVLVDFWAPWCGPCRAIAPLVEELATTYEGRLKVCKVDVDESPRVAASFQITSIPTLLVFKGGRVAEQVIGALPKPKLTALVDRHL